MPALSITAQPLDIEADVTALELDWLEAALREAETPGLHNDLAWARLERLAINLGMAEDIDVSAAAWAADYLARHGRHVPINLSGVIGSDEYRRHHIAMLWTAGLWHEAVQVLFLAVTLGLLFYAIAKGIQPWM